MMNLIQRRRSSYDSRLACKRTWFPKISKALGSITTESLRTIETKLKQSNYFQPENEGEKAILDILKYVNYISEDITGSTAEVHLMREEIRSISREVGMPHLFITINPADYYNPIYQILAGREINLETIFDNQSPGIESLEQSKLIAQNPVAGAKGFDTLLKAFIEILLGMGNKSQKGLFGEVESYYGVVEAQHHGSLHCHFLVWLKDALPPNTVRQKLLSSETWKNQLIAWLEDIISQDFPENSHPFDATAFPYPITPVMSMPPKSITPFNSVAWNQDLRNVLHITGQIHEHQNTCFKHLPKLVKKHKDPDRDCRFQLPRPLVEQTHFDTEGHLHLKCQNGHLNSYNTICVSCLRCNMDIKYVGSGTAALAMIQYVTNYIAKTSLDTSTVFSALCGAISALNNNFSNTGVTDQSERSRLLLVKICNSMIGKRELTGQQIASHLCDIPNKLTNHTFEKIYWSRILSFTSDSLFKENNSTEDAHLQSEEQDTGEHIVNSVQNLSDDSFILLTNTALKNSLSSEQIQPASITDDMFYRPHELQHLSLWELQQKFYRTKLTESSKSRGSANCFRFHTEHPLYTTHCLKHRAHEATPILIGPSIPRQDSPDCEEKYAAAMLTLFKPWNHSRDNVLKAYTAQTWQEAFSTFQPTLKPELKKVIDNMQALYQCRDAAHDYSEQRRRRLMDLKSTLTSSTTLNSEDDSWSEDPIWSFAMETEPEQFLAEDTFCEEIAVPLTLTKTENDSVAKFLQINQLHHFYNSSTHRNCSFSLDFSAVEGNEEDEGFARQQHRELMQEKESYLKNQSSSENFNPVSFNGDNSLPTYSLSTFVPPAFSTTLAEQYERIKQNLLQKYLKVFCKLTATQQCCCILIQKYSLNEEQTAAFLLYTDHIMKMTNTPLRLIIAGPGGTGKSQIFAALKEYHQYSGDYDSLKICAPTGLAATNIGGSTIHSEASLRTSYIDTETSRTNLENRFKNTKTLICDEIYFLGAKDNSKLSKNLSRARDNLQSGTIYGNLNLIFAGDPAQLPPPGATSLYSQKALKLYENQDFNMLNTQDTAIAEGIFAWKQFTKCIVLDNILQQPERDFQSLLTRLRFGNCTDDDYKFLQQFVIQNRPAKTNNNLLGIENWVKNRSQASPLICYTNILRDVHNFKMCKAFAAETKQQFTYYHSFDTMKGSKTVLKNTLAELAWRTAIKPAHDLAGRLPLIPGMPVFLTENLATELSLSNGSEGTLVKVSYYIWQGRRYPIYAEVDFESYINSSKLYPHQVVIVPRMESIEVKFPQENTVYQIQRKQLPLLPGFAYTAHNSQGRSLNRACIDLASCPSTATAYVMLSRIRSLAGVSILRPFLPAKICTHIPEEVQNELKRLNLLHQSTIRDIKSSILWYYGMEH